MKSLQIFSKIFLEFRPSIVPGVGKQCNRVKGHGKMYANDVIKNKIYNKNYRVLRKTKSM